MSSKGVPQTNKSHISVLAFYASDIVGYGRRKAGLSNAPLDGGMITLIRAKRDP